MKKRNVMIGVGAGTAILAACAVVKGLFDHKFSNEGLNDQEAEKSITIRKMTQLIAVLIQLKRLMFQRNQKVTKFLI